MLKQATKASLPTSPRRRRRSATTTGESAAAQAAVNEALLERVDVELPVTRPQLRWILTTDADGRTRPEAHWE